MCWNNFNASDWAASWSFDIAERLPGLVAKICANPTECGKQQQPLHITTEQMDKLVFVQLFQNVAPLSIINGCFTFLSVCELNKHDVIKLLSFSRVSRCIFKLWKEPSWSSVLFSIFILSCAKHTLTITLYWTYRLEIFYCGSHLNL